MVMLVREIMSKPVYTIEDKSSVKDAAKTMRKSRRGFLVVTQKRKAIGVLSDSDLIQLVASGKSPAAVKVSKVMREPIVTVDAGEDVLTAVRKMKTNNIHRLPVTESGRLVGVISLTDIARTSPEMVDLLEHRLKMKEEPMEIKEKETSGICDNCDNFSDRLAYIDDKWLCDDCREELDAEV